MWQWLYNIDKKLLLAINGHFNPTLDKIMWFASGTASWIPLYAILIIVVIITYKKESWLIILMIIPLILLSDQFASGVLKPLVHRYRPSHTEGLEYMLHYVQNYQGGSFGFTSSHASNTFALATYLTIVASRRLKWLPYFLFPWAAFISYSRMYLGVHFPSDVLAGAGCGMFFAWLISILYYKIRTRIKHN